MSGIDESLLSFPGTAGGLLGVLARPAAVTSGDSMGVIIVVGGPQTRVGSHRQFVLLARRLAAAGYPCLRFDYTGMGDSFGPKPDFGTAGADIRAACDALLDVVPGCRSIVLWGLCDGATAAAFHAVSDERIAAVIAANPWARSDSTRSATMVYEHYGSRLRSPAFWKKLLTGRVDVLTGVREFAGHLRRAGGARKAQSPVNGAAALPTARQAGHDLPARLADAISALGPRLHLQLSGNDLTAAEFELAMHSGAILKKSGVSAFRLQAADHTFSDRGAWDVVIADTIAVLGRYRTEEER